MIKKTKTVFICEYCQKNFRTPLECSRHESHCKIKKQHSDHLGVLLKVTIKYFEKLGYTVDFKYLDGELIWYLR